MARARGRSTQLRKSWSNMTPANSVAIGATQAVIGSVSIAESSLVAPTLLRSRGNLIVNAIPDAATDADTIGLGLIVVHSNALAAGGASVPGPIKDQGADWLWYRYVALDAAGATAEAATNNWNVQLVEVDSKAMRRVPEDHAVILVGEVDQGLFASVSVTGGIRFLFGQ